MEENLTKVKCPDCGSGDVRYEEYYPANRTVDGVDDKGVVWVSGDSEIQWDFPDRPALLCWDCGFRTKLDPDKVNAE